MSPNEVRELGERELVELIVSSKPVGEDVVLLLAALVSGDAAFEGVRELRRRFARRVGEVSMPVTESGQHKNANTVMIDGDRFRSFCYRRRLALTAVGPMFGRCAGWASVICHKGQAGFYALDEMATVLDTTVSDLIFEIGTDDERARLAVCS